MSAQAEFSKAFNSDKNTKDEPMQPAPADEGVTDANKNDVAATDAGAEGAADAPAVAVVIGTDAKPEGDSAANDAATEPEDGNVASEAAAEGEPVSEESAEKSAPGGDTDDGALSPEDQQRQKSWEGRLKKREEELATREAALNGGEGNSDAAPDDAEIADIKSRLSEDFGQDFVDMICKLAAYEAKKNGGADLGGVTSRIDEVVKDFQAALQSQHLADISAAHEDFIDIVSSPEFGAWIDGLEPDQQDKARAVIERGSAQQCVKLLNLYKDSLKQQQASDAGADTGGDSGNADAMDAAEGVRSSSPISLPTAAPADSDDEYRRAWDAM